MKIIKFFKEIVFVKRKKALFKSNSTRIIEYNVSSNNVNTKYPDNYMRTTRYRIWNFIILNLLEQFSKVANFYFGLMAIIAIALGDKSPVDASTTIAPLLFVVLLSVIKQAYEDVKRYKNDRLVNLRLVKRYSQSKFENIYSKNIRVGDIMAVNQGEEIPCDLLLIGCEHLDNCCYITTVNLDGETTSQIRKPPDFTIDYSVPENLSLLSCRIECEDPTYDIYRFVGKMVVYNEKDGEHVEKPLSHINFLPRGAKISQPDIVYGIAIFTGKDTKLALNQQKKRRKVTCVERKMNKCIWFFVSLLLIISILFTILKYTISINVGYWYLYDIINEKTPVSVIVDIASYFYLFSNLIPISLYVTLEVQKFIGVMFIDWDLDLYNFENDQPAKSNTSDLLEELGQINYIFTDKTGTLTENQMILLNFSVNESLYSYSEQLGSLFDQKKSKISSLTDDMKSFLIYASLCHTVDVRHSVEPEVIVNRSVSFEIPTYIASSPDEKAILEFTSKMGVVFMGKSRNKLKLLVLNEMIEFTTLYTLDFDPTRKRMSVIIKNNLSEYWLITKGADSHVMPLITSGQRVITQKFVDECSSNGLRTLVVAVKKLTTEEFNHLSDLLDKANKTIENRDEKLQEAYSMIELDLHIIGMIAIEDKLQENVKETIECFRAANIAVWILTGDKHETAINIGFNCGHLSNSMDIVTIINHVNDEKLKACIDEVFLRVNSNVKKEYAIVLDGSTFSHLYKSYKNEFVQLISYCKSFVCCRMSPVQKAQIVKLVRNLPHGPITLSIGDGANDCAMIQEAHIGIGIFGKEGRQAVQCSDFAISRFKYLKKLLFFHGHVSYYRVCHTILYFIYKNLILVFPMFIHIFYSFYGPNMLYQPFLYTFYNVTWTSLPIFLYGLFERDYDTDSLMTLPKYYSQLSNNSLLTLRNFIYWIFNGVYQGFIIYLFAYYAMNITDHYAQWIDFYIFSHFVYMTVIITANIQFLLMIRSLNIFLLLSPIFSVLCFIFLALIYSVYLSNHPNSLIGNFSFYYTAFAAMKSGFLHLLSIIIIIFAVSPHIIYELIYSKTNAFYSSIISYSTGLLASMTNLKTIKFSSFRN